MLIPWLHPQALPPGYIPWLRPLVAPVCSDPLIEADLSPQDAGYGEKSMFAPDQDEDDEAKIEDEVSAVI